MKKPAQKTKATTQEFIEVEEIFDNVVILKNGNACLIIEITAANFSLLSKDEQDAKIFSYAALLNSLAFPIQIFIQSKKIDISSYLKLLDGETKKTENQKFANQIKLYRDFVEELIDVNSVLDKKFYIVIPYSYLEGGIKMGGDFATLAKAALLSKAQSFHSQLARLNLKAKTLEKEELIKLFYGIYNEESAPASQIAENAQSTIIKIGGKP